jgi:serine/threonine-protein kinase
VQWTLEGKAADLKEYLLGVEVFDRKASYDPRVDPIVRVEARRLRSKLKAYYEGDGRTDAIVIEFLKGSYAPQIRARTQAPPSPEPARPVPGIDTIAVLPLVNLSADPDNEYFSDGLTEELIHALTKLPGMRVVAWTRGPDARAAGGDRRHPPAIAGGNRAHR